jgi:4-diphosphocytidyl-2-C-methyl-D-erythritol kinase
MAYAGGVMHSRAYAKINLTLAVSPPEPAGHPRAGWHRIASWFHAVDLWDDVEMSPASDGQTTLDIAFSGSAPHCANQVINWPMETDLGVRALRALESAVGRSLPAHLKVRKRIPAGGGLGGGSSNAAAVLKLANEFFHLGLSGTELIAIGRMLGSDVEFFLDEQGLQEPPRAAFIQGFGDEVERVQSFTDPITLLITGVECPTPQVYRTFDQLKVTTFNPDRARAALEVAQQEGRVVDEMLFNQLTSAACMLRPQLETALATAARLLGSVHLSGSGGSAFILGHAASHPPQMGVIATRLV